jgi:hypothetical protein
VRTFIGIPESTKQRWAAEAEEKRAKEAAAANPAPVTR